MIMKYHLFRNYSSYVSMVLDNGMAPTGQQVIIQASDDSLV